MKLPIGVISVSSALLTAAPAAAEQFVVAEATYTHSAQTTKDSHYFVEPSTETPEDWTQPVDYARGSVHVRLEVKTKPSSEPTRYQICFEMKQNYCCTHQAPPYGTTGVYEWDTPVEDMWRPGPVDFAQGIVRSALILKDTENVKPAPENVGEETSQLYLPSDLRVTVTVVSAGSDFEPPDEPIAGAGAGGGGGASGMAGGGASGSAGQAGSGGAGSGGVPAITPEPVAGTAPVVSGGGAGGATSAQPATASTAESSSCSFSARPSAGSLELLALLGACALARRRTPGRPRPSATSVTRPARR